MSNVIERLDLLNNSLEKVIKSFCDSCNQSKRFLACDVEDSLKSSKENLLLAHSTLNDLQHSSFAKASSWASVSRNVEENLERVEKICVCCK